MFTTYALFANRRRQSGAALVVGLLLLVVITVLAVSGINTATTELALARNNQASEDAFQAAETGLAIALSRDHYTTAMNATIPLQLNTEQSVTIRIQYEDSTRVPDKAFSLGGGIAAHHFLATAESRIMREPGTPTDRDATATHTQAFYVIGPELPEF
jgi:type IV pilus assembly protein PilX